MKRYVIDGIFLTRELTGTQRFARETVSVLDRDPELVQRLEILVPENAEVTDPPAHIPVVRFGRRRGRNWQQLDLPRYLKMRGAEGLYLENTMSLRYPGGVIVLHDVILRARPEYFRGSLRGILYILWRRILYRRIACSGMPVLTVSEFSKSEIMKYYGIAPSRIRVLCNGWQHMERIGTDETALFSRFPELAGRPYLFFLSSLMPHKNVDYVLRAARKNPELFFVMGGGAGSDRTTAAKFDARAAAPGSGASSPSASSPGALPPNVLPAGYLRDTEIKTLMKHCEAFLFPSLYEGFGIPPLEAAAAGAPRLILSDIPVLREICGEAAYYIDPLSDGEDLPRLLALPPLDYTALLSRCSWEKAAQGIKETLSRGEMTDTHGKD